jgi:Tol biopolymer transport system component
MSHAYAACAAAVLTLFTTHQSPSPARVDEQSPQNQNSQLTLDPLSAGNDWQVSPAWNPDGVRVATVSKRDGQVDLWVTNVDTGQAERWTNDREGERDPRWSPDGQCLAYVTAREREGIDVKCVGAATRRVVADGQAPQWSADGKRILYARRSAGRLQILTIPADGQGTATELLPWLASDLPGGWGVQWHPDGERLIVIGWYKPGKLGLWAVAPTAGPPLGKPRFDLVEILKPAGSYHTLVEPSFSRTGDAMFVATAGQGRAQIWRIPLDARTVQNRGSAEVLAQGDADSVSYSVAPSGGRLAVAWESARTHVWVFPFTPDTGRVDFDNGEALGPEHGVAAFPEFSRDGERLVYTTWTRETGLHEVHIRERNGADRVLLTGKDFRFGPRWSPDGSSLAYRWQSVNGLEFAVRLVDAQNGAERGLTGVTPNAAYTPYTWTRDREALLASYEYRTRTGATAYAIARVPLTRTGERTPTVIAANEQYKLWQSGMSPDARWIVFVAQPLDDAWSSIMVVPAQGGTAWTALTDQRGWDDKPRWSADGRTIYFLSRRSGEFELWRLPFDPASGKPTGAAEQLTRMSDAQRHLYRGVGWLELAISSARIAVPIEEMSSRFAVVPAAPGSANRQ